MEWFTLVEHPVDRMLYIRESFVGSSRPIQYIIWHPTGWSASAYAAAYGADRIGMPLVPTPGPELVFHFKNLAETERIAIDTQVRCQIQQQEQVELAPPELQKRFRGILFPRWHEGTWMYYAYQEGSYGWRPILPKHLVRSGNE